MLYVPRQRCPACRRYRSAHPCVITTLPKWLRPSKWRGCVGLGERECPVDHRAQAMLLVRFIASKSARLPTLIAPTVMPQPVSNNGSSIAPDGDRARADQAEMSAHGQGLQ